MKEKRHLDKTKSKKLRHVNTPRRDRSQKGDLTVSKQKFPTMSLNTKKEENFLFLVLEDFFNPLLPSDAFWKQKKIF